MALYTAEYWFNKIEDPEIRERAIANIKDRDVLMPSLKDAIATAFWWSHTEEGAFYWKEIHDNL